MLELRIDIPVEEKVDWRDGGSVTTKSMAKMVFMFKKHPLFLIFDDASKVYQCIVPKIG
jgi:hypothetical protein